MRNTEAGATPAARDRGTRRGAALIIAIAIMTVLLAIGLTFFTVARVESVTAMNVVNTVRAEHLVDAGFAMAEYRLNRDLLDHPQATSLDHAWRSMFNGAAFAGKNWATQHGDGNPANGSPAFNLVPVERALRAAAVIPPSSLLYVRYEEDGYIEPLFRGARTAPWLSIPRWQGNDILIYPQPGDGAVRLCGADGVAVDDTVVNAALAAQNVPYRIVRFEDREELATWNAGLYPFVTASFFGPVAQTNRDGEVTGYPWAVTGLEALWPAEQVDRWTDVDTNDDGMNDSIWVPLPKDVDLAADGVDNDLDGVVDATETDEQGQIALDYDGNPRRDIEIGAFVYRVDNNTGRVVRSPGDITGPTRLVLTLPLPGLRLPVDMDNDGRIDGSDFQGSDGGPVYVILPSQINVPMGGGTVQTLTMNDVDTLDNDYDQFVNGFNAYVFLGDPDYTGHSPWENDKAAALAAGFGNPKDTANARLKYSNKVIKWRQILPGVTVSANAPDWLKNAQAAGNLPVVISLTGEPVCDIIGRAAIHVADESSKVNMNAAGGHVYRDNIAGDGRHIMRAFNQGVSTYEYETRALPDMGVKRASNLWGMLAGAGWMTDPPTGSKWNFGPLPVKSGDTPLIEPPLQPYTYDISLAGYGRVDDNMNALLLAFNGRADAGTPHPDQGLWVPPLGPLAESVLAGLDLTTLTAAQRQVAVRELQGSSPDKVPYAEVADAVRGPRMGNVRNPGPDPNIDLGFKAYYNLLGMLEGMDEPGELQPSAPLRNAFAETDKTDNNSDLVADEIGEGGDRLLANSYELLKAVENDGGKILGPLTWPKNKNVVTANSDSRNVNYLETAAGWKGVSKIDPNLAPPGQLAAGMLLRGGIKPATDQYFTDADQPFKIGLPKYDADLRLDFAEGLRQADTSFSGAIFDRTDDPATGGFVPPKFDADPVLQAMQVAVNIADSRDADCVRSMLVMDKQVDAAYESYYTLPVNRWLARPLNPPAEALNERERTDRKDAFPVGDLQDMIINALGPTMASTRVIAPDQWWQNVTNMSDGNEDVQTDREDRTISYAAAGVDAIRINEMMVRPVRRVEAEAVTHIMYDLSSDSPDLGVRRFPVIMVAQDGTAGAQAALPYNNLNPTPYVGMPSFDMETITEFPPATTQWKMRSPYDTAPAAGGTASQYPYVLGDETAMVYTTDPATGTWVSETADLTLQLEKNINDDIIEFRIRTTKDGYPQGLPPGRYYLTINVADPVTGVMTVDDTDQLQYSIKYTNSMFAYTPTGGVPSIAADIAFIDGIPLNSADPNYAAQLYEQNKLRADYFDRYWQTVDQPDFIATDIRRNLGSGEPTGWVFAPARDPGAPLNETDYPNLHNLVGGVAVFQKLFYVPPQPDPLNPTVPLLPDAPYCWSQSYFRDGIMPFGTFNPVGADQPTGTRTLTVIVPPNDPTAPYDTVCIAFRLKPKLENLVLRDPVTKDPVINPATGNPYPRSLAINFLDFSQQPDHEYVELANTTDKAINLGGWTLEVGIPDPAGIDEDPTMRDPFKSRWTVPAGTVIAPKGYLLLGFDKFDRFQTPPQIPPDQNLDNLVTRNGMGLAAGTASPGQGYVAAPPMGGMTTAPTPQVSPYWPLDDVTASVFERNTPAYGAPTDYIDNDGDGVTSAPFVNGYYNATGNYVFDADHADLDTDGVASEAKCHGDANGVVPPFARIVPLQCKELWTEDNVNAEGSPYSPVVRSVTMAKMQTLQYLARLVLRGGILPDYPEHDGHDNDGDGGYVTKDGINTAGFSTNSLLHYVRGTLDKDMVDNNLDGRIDENGMEQVIRAQNPSTGNWQWIYQNGNPLHSEGVDEGRFTIPVVQPMDLMRPRIFASGSYEEGDLPLQFSPSVTGYRVWEQALRNRLFDAVNNKYLLYQVDGVTQVVPEDGFPYNPLVFTLPYSAEVKTIDSPVVFRENPVTLPQATSPEWKAFCERRWNAGDAVVVTLHVGAPAERKVADRVTYREQDVTNRAVDDIQESPYYVEGYRSFVYVPATPTTPAYNQWVAPTGSVPVADRVCLDRNRPQYWLPNQMGLDFYRSLERKHPLYAGDKFGTSNRWEATDGSYDDWSDSLSAFEAVEEPLPDGTKRNASSSPSRRDVPPGAARLFGHAMSGSPLRMNTQQRLWDNPADLVAYLVHTGGVLNGTDPEGLANTIPLDAPAGGTGKRRQFVESDSVTPVVGGRSFVDSSYTLRRAEVRNRPFNSVGDLMRLPMLSFSDRKSVV